MVAGWSIREGILEVALSTEHTGAKWLAVGLASRRGKPGQMADTGAHGACKGQQGQSGWTQWPRGEKRDMRAEK